ncbi:hypothetical protein ACFVJ5_00630 [Nocardia sp. NPDC127606]|uniref:hypothetical protein n=1 Tax=Nocardia sp. NPDC127606 TaxID=3345406 RepID=UPI0036405D5D
MTTFEPGEPPVRRNRLDSNTVARLDDVTTFAQLLDALELVRMDHPDARILCTLDDLGQCAYTSMHATLGLVEGEGGAVHDDPDDPAATHHAENATVSRIAALLDNPSARVPWDALRDTRNASEDELAALVAANRSPDRVVDDVVLIQRVPVDRDDLAIAGIPNGYFADDWSTYDNHTVIRRMATHGYRHIAIGASLLAFARPTAPTPEQAAALVTDLTHLYGSPTAIAWHELAVLLPTQRQLVLGYAENFADALTADTEGAAGQP